MRVYVEAMALSSPRRGEKAGAESYGEVDVVQRHDPEADIALVEVVPPWRLELGGDLGSGAPAVCGLLASGRRP